MKITYSAPGKIILSGEHAAVYAKPIVISALNLRLTVTIEPSNTHHTDKNMDFVASTVKEYLKKQNISFKDRPFKFSIKSEIPQGKNLGSSAAYSVACVAALLHFYTGKQWDKETINKLAYEIEKMFHGKPSGGDNSASCFGGLIFFRKEFEFLKTLSSLTIKIPQTFSDHLLIIDSGKPVESTKDMVMDVVGGRFNKNPRKMELLFNSIEKVTKRIVMSITTEDIEMFKASIEENEKYLERVGAVSAKTRALLKSLAPYGAGKVTGGGGKKEGSGNILFFAHDKDKLFSHLRKNNIPFLPFHQDFEGVRWIK